MSRAHPKAHPWQGPIHAQGLFMLGPFHPEGSWGPIHTQSPYTPSTPSAHGVPSPPGAHFCPGASILRANGDQSMPMAHPCREPIPPGAHLSRGPMGAHPWFLPWAHLS